MAELSLERVGFAGVGIMGGPLTRRLVERERSLIAWNRSPEKAEELAAESSAVEVAAVPAELGQADVVMMMLLHSEACERVLLDESDGLLAGEALPEIVVNMSTIEPSASQRFREACAERGVAYLASPVSGSTMFARGGQLTIMLSGAEEPRAAVMPLLEDVAQKVLAVGEGVEAHLLKLAVNMVIGAYSSAMYEAIALCSKGGVGTDTYMEVLNESAIGTPYSKYKTKGLVERDYTTAHSVQGLDKDYDLMAKTAKELSVPVPITALVQQQLRASVGRGDGPLDMTALLKQALADAGLDGVGAPASEPVGAGA